MEYIVVFVEILFAGKLVLEAYQNLKPGADASSTPPEDVYYSAESIVTLMHKYWRWRLDHARSPDEGGNCLLLAGQSVAHFKKVVERSIKIENNQHQNSKKDDIQYALKTDNVIPFRDK